MANESGKKDRPASQSDSGVKRRGLLRFGTLITAVTGASAMSAIGANSARADTTPLIAYVPVKEKGAPSGVATLDKASKIVPAQLPDLSATYVDKVSAAAAKGIKTASVATSSYTLGLGDRGNAVEVNATTDTKVIVPLTASVDFPIGTEIEVVRIGPGAVSIEPAFRNFVTNPSMEVDLAGWVARTGGLKRIAAAALLGSYGARASSTASGQYFGFFHQIPGTLETLGLNVGDVVSARVNVRSNFANGGQIGFRFQAGTTTISTTFGATVVNGVAVIENVTIPAGTDNMMLVSQTLSTAPSQSVDWDGLIAVKGATAPASYADGDTEEYGWLGAAHASQSTGPLFRDSNLSLGRFGKAVLRKRAANEWILANALPSEALLTTATLQVDRDNGQPGMIAPGTPLSTLSTVALTSGRACLARFVPSRTMYITKLAFRVQTASGTDDPCDVGIYDASGTRLVSSGAKTSFLNTTGTKSITITTTKLTAGVPYYAAFSATSRASLSHATVIGDGFGAGAPALELQKKDASYPLPTSLTGLGGSDSGPVIFVRES